MRDTCGLFEDYTGGLAVDDVGGFVYWVEGDKIKQTSLNGSNRETILETGKLTVTYKRIH